MTNPDLSIVIITLNEARRLPQLLADLNSQSFRNFEILHVDSNSDDETVVLSRAASAVFDHYRIIEMKRRGVSLGRNTGAAAALGKRLLFLDADTRLPPTFLAEAIEDLDKREISAGIVCMSGEGLALRYRIGFGLFNLGIRLTSYLSPTAVGACMFSTPQVHRMIGGFDEGLSLCEDCNYALKARRAGAVTKVIHPKFRFDPRRLEQDGLLATGSVYLRANLRRFMRGELHNQEIPYQFGHYDEARR